MIFALDSSRLRELGITPAATIFNSAGKDVTLTRSDPTIQRIQSGQSTMDIIQSNREHDRTLNLLSARTQDLVHQNLIGLGEASIDISEALNNENAVRESQREADQGLIKDVFDFANSNNTRLSEQVENLGDSITDLSNAEGAEKAAGSIFDGLGLPSFEQIKLPLIIAGLAIAGLAGFKILKVFK